MKEDAAIIISVMWAIWTSRNKFTHNEVQFQPHRLMELIRDHVQSLDFPKPGVERPVQRHTLEAPEHGWMKLNSDGAVDQVLQRSGTGIVVPDGDGQFLTGRCKKYQGAFDPLAIELSACRDAMILLASEQGYNYNQVVIVE